MIKTKKRKYIRATKFLVGGLVIGAVILLFTAIFMITVIATGVDNGKKEREYRRAASELVNSSEYLTYLSLNYVVTEKPEYYEDYMQEVQIDKTRENAAEVLLKLGVTEREYDIVSETLEISYTLEDMEREAFALLDDGNTDKAREIVFSSEYNDLKDEIRSNFVLLKDAVEKRLTEQAERILKKSYQTFFVTIIIVISTIIASVLLLINFLRAKDASNIDELTGLQNRNGYKEHIEKLIRDEPDKYGALIFCDIDNLKFVNDCYGHNNGDRYIQSVADSLKGFSKYNSVLARPSGDEFVIYIHGFNNKEEVQMAVESGIKEARNSYFMTTLHVEEKVRFSTGGSIYPTDSTNVEELLKYSDYAMFKMKKSSKGELAFYDKNTFDKSTYLISNRGYLDEFLEKELVDFAMQPIVDTKTFEIYGYEALMRPQLDIIGTPYLILQLAKEESKLDKLERLVLKKVLEKINSNIDILGNYKIFINSISSQVLEPWELEEYIKQYPYLFKNIVFEVTEQEYADEKFLKRKAEVLRKYGALIALDDYGSGYSNELSLLSQSYDIIKIDMKLIRSIDTDVKRQELVASILKVSKINNYKVVAEGVETIEEVKTLKALGVHYLQGYFFGKPDLQIKGINEEAIQKLK